MRVVGLAARGEDLTFAFMVVRLVRAVDRAALVALIQQLAPLLPDADAFLADFPDELEEAMWIIGMPWAPPEVHELELQRALIEAAADHGIETAWFFQTGAVEEGGEVAGVPDVADPAARSVPGVTQRGSEPRFPVDGYPEVLDEPAPQDLGIAFKLGGPWLPGESTVVLGLHALWLSPYEGGYRNAGVTVDQRHHAAHLWVDRFTAPSPLTDRVHHLLWVLSQLDQITPVIHARFVVATSRQRHGELEDGGEPFVLGGNPLMAIHEESRCPPEEPVVDDDPRDPDDDDDLN